MQNLSQNEERTWTIAQAEANHLNEGQNDCEDVKTWNKNLNEGYQKE